MSGKQIRIPQDAYNEAIRLIPRTGQSIGGYFAALHFDNINLKQQVEELKKELENYKIKKR